MPQSKEIFGTRASLQKSTLHRSSIRDPQLPNFQNPDDRPHGDRHASDTNIYDVVPQPRRLRARRRRRRAARRPFRRLRWGIESLRTVLVRLWFRLPFVHRFSHSASDESFCNQWDSDQWDSGHWDSGYRDDVEDDQNSRIFPPRYRRKKRKGQPEGTKGAGSRSL